MVPDRYGMATGMAVGGSAVAHMVAAPLAQKLIGFFQTPTSVGLWQAFAVMAAAIPL